MIIHGSLRRFGQLSLETSPGIQGHEVNGLVGLGRESLQPFLEAGVWFDAMDSAGLDDCVEDRGAFARLAVADE